MSHALASNLQELKNHQLVDSSLQSIQDEIEALLIEVAAQFDCEPDDIAQAKAIDGPAIQQLCRQLSQIAGALSMVQMEEGSRLLQHAKLAIEKLLEKDAIASLKQRQAIFESCFLLSRYLEFARNTRKSGGSEIPLVLMPNFYALASTGLAPFIDESELAGIQLMFSTESQQPGPDGEDRLTFRRLRKMYQVALIGLLRGVSLKEQLTLVERVTVRSAELLSDPLAVALWKLLGSLVAEFQGDNLAFNANRRHFFARFDRYLKVLSKGEALTFSAESDAKCMRELVFLLELAGKGDLVEQVAGSYIQFDKVEWTDDQIEAQRTQIGSGLKESLVAMSEAISQTLIDVKHRLSVMSESDVCENTDVDFILESIGSMSSVLSFCGFDQPATALIDCRENVTGWREEGPEESELLTLANAILIVENTLLCYSAGGLSSQQDMSLEEGLTHQAHQHLFEEMQANLSLANRAVNSYIESNRDREHIANISNCLMTTVGAFKIIGIDDAANLMQSCAELLGQEYKRTSDASARPLDSLADSLVSTEYLLHELASGRSLDGAMSRLIQENQAAISRVLEAT